MEVYRNTGTTYVGVRLLAVYEKGEGTTQGVACVFVCVKETGGFGHEGRVDQSLRVIVCGSRVYDKYD